ncbi:MAG: WbqC family protein [Bacteroidota bacterium]
MQEKNTSALIELHYLPCVQYLTQFLSNQQVIIEQWEHYQKGSYRNRCHIMGANGLLRLSIPLQSGKNQQMNIREVKISYQESWQALHWKSINSAYRNAPFFEYYADYIAPFYEQKESFLFDWNYKLLIQILDLLQLENNTTLSKEYDVHPIFPIVDMRNSIQAKKSRHKNVSSFEASPYAQVFQERHGFVSNLSILDLLFCTGPQAILYLE